MMRRYCENRALYRKYLLDHDYREVHFDMLSGGVSAIHRNHRFDQQKGPYGIKRGEYEMIVLDTLRRKGFSIILASERAARSVKTPDGTLNGIVMDIKAVESAGRWAIKDKFHEAVKQGVAVLVLYFHKQELFSENRIQDGWDKYLREGTSQVYAQSIRQVVCVVGDKNNKSHRVVTFVKVQRGQVEFLSPLRCKGKKKC